MVASMGLKGLMKVCPRAESTVCNSEYYLVEKLEVYLVGMLVAY